MKKAIVTGANKSIGSETARQVLQQGYYVYLGSCSLTKGQKAVEKLKADGPTGKFISVEHNPETGEIP